MNIEDYGVTSEIIAEAKKNGLIAGRIISHSRNLYEVVNENGICKASVSGKFRYEIKNIEKFPAVGDFVFIDKSNNTVIHKVFPRKTAFIRKTVGKTIEKQVVVVNIDIVFICMSLNNDYNLRRLERYLTISWDSGATPVVVLTKSDLCDDLQSKICEVEKVAIGVDVVAINAINGDGLKNVKKYLTKGKTIALLGSSGVGKSTFINCLLNNNILTTNSIRNNDKGRHTTTKRELILLDNGCIVIDTPGMRELGIIDVENGIDKTFEDIMFLSKKCRYSNCTHNNEPFCAVKKAIKDNVLAIERFNSFQKLNKNIAYDANRLNYLSEKEKKFKEISKINKSR